LIQVADGNNLGVWQRTKKGKVVSSAIANADEVLRPNGGDTRAPDHPRWAGHPRNERTVPKRIDTVLPKSRDFH
ncbi:MAG: hypothetical protein AAFR01_09010, partial [Pseudomonadota bacterium]